MIACDGMELALMTWRQQPMRCMESALHTVRCVESTLNLDPIIKSIVSSLVANSLFIPTPCSTCSVFRQLILHRI